MLHKKLLEVFIGKVNAHLFKAAMTANRNEVQLAAPIVTKVHFSATTLPTYLPTYLAT